jgi:hypothetical protein
MQTVKVKSLATKISYKIKVLPGRKVLEAA